jgi:hypothetical protein
MDKVSKTTNRVSKPFGFPHLLFLSFLLGKTRLLKQLPILFRKEKNKRSAFANVGIKGGIRTFTFLICLVFYLFLVFLNLLIG